LNPRWPDFDVITASLLEYTTRHNAAGRNNRMRSLSSSFIALIAAALTSIIASPAAMAADTYYISPPETDLVHILAPPPTPDSPAGKADLQAVLAAVNARTEAGIKQAQEDDKRTVFRFADVMGPNFRTENLPLTTQLFKHVYEDGNAATLAAKNLFKRMRPFVVDPEIKIIVDQPPDFSYPSNHSTFGNEAGILLADMVPENAVAIFARAADYAHNRVVAGVHFPTDVEGGRIAASVIDNTLLHNPRFAADYALAKAEMRAALGLAPGNQ
jgi:acid phosphatase (class A)